MWILSQLLHLAGQTTTIIPVFSGPVVCAFLEFFSPTFFLMNNKRTVVSDPVLKI